MNVQEGNHAARILAVDDEIDNLLILSDYLHEAGYHAVTTVSDPFKALEHFKAELFDLVLLDIIMPGLDGFAVMSRMQQLERQLGPEKSCPILVLTVSLDEKTRLRALSEGARDFLPKPFLEEELLCRVKNLLDMHLAQKHLRTLNQQLDAIICKRTVQLEERNQQLIKSQLEVLERLALAAEFRDNETGLHMVRMSHYAHIIGQELGLGVHESTLLLHSAPLHDVGKVGIPDTILLKLGKLDPEEWAIMKRHATIGEKILANSHSPWLEASRVIALTHHERWDGKGYPQGLPGDQIPLFGRITAVADVFDALTSVRPYKPAWPVTRAVATIQEGSGTQFEPNIVAAFLRTLPKILTIKDQHQDGEKS